MDMSKQKLSLYGATAACAVAASVFVLSSGAAQAPATAPAKQAAPAQAAPATKPAAKPAALPTAEEAVAIRKDRAMFLSNYNRNNYLPAEKGLPTTWDVATGQNIKWSQPVGSQSYGGPVIANGRVVVGTNNEGRRNAKLGNDRGVVMAFNEADGAFLWQMTHEKLPETKLHDWPLQGVSATPAVEGDRVYYVSNRAQVVAVDLEGFRDGQNDGPYTEEKETSEIDGDVIWSYDMMAELDVFPHNLAASSPLIVGDVVYVTTGNGVDEGHVNIPSPLAPSFIALDKNTGKLLWESADPSPHILHGTWSNASYGVIGGVPQIVFPGGNGWVYGFEPLTGKELWRFDCNPKDSVWRLGGSGTRNNLIATGVIHGDRVYIAVGQDPEHGESIGHLYSIDATKRGDITESGRVWHRGGNDFHRTIASAVVHDGIVYAADLSGFLYALDVKTGDLIWKHDNFAAIWGSPMVADGKVYLGDEDGDVAIVDTGKTLKVHGEHNMGSSVYTTVAAHDGVLYVLARNRLFAIQNGAKSEPVKAGAGG
jgi:outer membrane protein assembly factor BamB